MKPEEIYRYLPGYLQDCGACSIYGAQLIRRRYGRTYSCVEREIFEREVYSRERIQEVGWLRLRKILDHAARTVPILSRLFERIGVDPRDFKSPKDLRSIPVLTKSTVQEHLPKFTSVLLPRQEYSIVRTSGTTGAGLLFPLTLRAEQEQWAVCWRYRARFGVKLGMWYAHFFGKSVVPYEQSRPPFWRINWPGRQILFSAFHLKREYLPHYIDYLNHCRPAWVQGYPSILAVIANYILERGERLSFKPVTVMSSSETLLPHQRSAIEAAFGVPCRQLYGATEAVASISECPEGNLHVDEDYACVEFLPAQGNICRIVGTGYSNYAFPMIRYDLGDLAEVVDTQCACGLPGRVVRSIDGRVEDYIVTPDGRLIGRLDHIFKNMVHVREAQIVQEENGAVVLRVVRSEAYTERDEEALLSEARRRLGPDLTMGIEYVNLIERTQRGKVRFVISRLKRPFGLDAAPHS